MHICSRERALSASCVFGAACVFGMCGSELREKDPAGVGYPRGKRGGGRGEGAPPHATFYTANLTHISLHGRWQG